MREARLHVRHVRELLHSIDSVDAYNGADCNSLSYVNAVTEEDLSTTGMLNQLWAKLNLVIFCQPIERDDFEMHFCFDFHFGPALVEVLVIVISFVL